jgi:hypothetical protein
MTDICLVGSDDCDVPQFLKKNFSNLKQTATDLKVNVKVKVKVMVTVKLSLCLTKHHATKTYRGRGGTDPRILNLGTTYR